MLLANEFVTNAVVHAHTDIRLRLELRGDRLHIGVRDGDPRLLRLVPPDAEAEGGRGLWLVEQLAEAWGGPPSPRWRQGRMVHPPPVAWGLIGRSWLSGWEALPVPRP
jgi:two-component sensor histidine kinase